MRRIGSRLIVASIALGISAAGLCAQPLGYYDAPYPYPRYVPPPAYYQPPPPAYLQRIKNLPIQQLVAQAGVEALDVAVLPEAQVVIESWRRHYNAAHTSPLAIGHPRLKSSYQRSPRGRFRARDPLQRPR